MNRFSSACFTIFFCAASHSHAAGDPISFRDVPEAVKAAAVAAANGAKLASVARELEDGQNIYEFIAERGDGSFFEIDITEDGSLQEVERDIRWAETPESVREALDLFAPGFKPRRIEFSRHPDGHHVYEFEGFHEGVRVEVDISADGVPLSYTRDGV
ncbi:MAG: hypothetical protein AAF850_02335 [Pseudomonadota bacterium]